MGYNGFNDNRGRPVKYSMSKKKQQLNPLLNHERVELNELREEVKINHKKGKYRSYKGEFSKICSNYLLENGKRNFKTVSFNEKWTTDVSEFHIPAGKLYLSPILDMHNREIISYFISKSPNFNQTLTMLNKAFNKFDNLKGLIFYSDQGWQYQMPYYKKILKERGIIQSMSRKGNCLDNSIMENYFGIMKNEMFYGHEFEFKSLYDLEQAMIKYIDYYNKQRITVKLKGLSPIEYRQQS